MSSDRGELSEPFGQAWNRFWFRAVDPSTLALMRILAGLSVVAYVSSHTADLLVWFADDGILPIETVRQLTGAAAPDQPTVYRWSYFYLFSDPSLLWIAHSAGLGIGVALTVGWNTRVACLASLAVVLSYVHRAPLITGLAEPVLSMLLLYLCLGPSGARYSFDAWRRAVRDRSGGGDGRPELAASPAANFSIRLMQVHLSALYMMMGLTKLAGTTWWSGEAVWWIAARTESRVLDWTFLHDYLLLFNLWTHGIVWFEISFAVLIWNARCRRVLLLLAAIHWILLALLTGMVGYCLLMIIANLCFVPPRTVRAFLTKLSEQKSVAVPT